MKYLGLTALGLALMSSSAFAADLIVDTPAPMAPVSYNDSAAYFAIYGGLNLLNEMDYDSTGSGGGSGGVLNFDNGYSLDAALGYKLGGGLSLEAQVGYLNSNLTDGTYNGTPFPSGGSASALYAMANAWYGVDLGGVTPFIGGGVGVASLTLDGQFGAPLSGAAFKDSAVTYAAQVGAGVSVKLADNIDLTGRYRYFMTGDVDFTDGDGDKVSGHLGTSIVDVGLKVSF